MGRQSRLKDPHTVATDAIAFVDRFRVLTSIRHVVLGAFSQASIVASVRFSLSQVQDVPVSPVPVVVVVAMFQTGWLEAAVLLRQIPRCVGPGQKSSVAGGVQAVVLGDMPRFDHSARRCARSLFADVFHAGNRDTIAQGVDGRHGIVIHVPAVIVETLRYRVQRDVPKPHVQAHLVPDSAIRAGDGTAHHVSVIIELPDRVGQFSAVQDHWCRLASCNVVPVEHGPTLFSRRGPVRGHAVEHAVHVRVVRISICDDLDVAELSFSQAR